MYFFVAMVKRLRNKYDLLPLTVIVPLKMFQNNQPRMSPNNIVSVYVSVALVTLFLFKPLISQRNINLIEHFMNQNLRLFT